jgi:membrane dipeptidase
MTPMPIFDGHNDVLLRLNRRGGADAPRAFLDGEGKGHLDLPMAKQGGFAGGLFAVFVPSPERPPSADNPGIQLDEKLPPPLEVGDAQKVATAMAALLFRIERESGGRVLVCRSEGEIAQCIRDGVLAAVLHMEGAEAIDSDFAMLDVLNQAGLKSLGPVWSRPNAFAYGVPFRMNSTPDIGPGLTDLGKELIRVCNKQKIMLDLSHLNEKGFWDVAALSDAPLVASHSNAHALCPHARNVTDKQCAAIRESGGLVGINFATNFIRPDGGRNRDTPLGLLVDHLEHLVKVVGEDGVGIGSDFDGAMMPADLSTAAGLPNLVTAMRERQFGEALVEKICYRNWLRVLKKTWGG